MFFTVFFFLPFYWLKSPLVINSNIGINVSVII
uniref:Uncharacterized protein n=1 Tax=Rhizophora mucronata TaxID=61149 RepID=A0A2P2QAQ1_RHIMU